MTITTSRSSNNACPCRRPPAFAEAKLRLRAGRRRRFAQGHPEPLGVGQRHVEKNHVDVAPIELLQGGVEPIGVFEREFVAARIGDHLAPEAGVGRVVLDQQDFEVGFVWAKINKPAKYQPGAGRAP